MFRVAALYRGKGGFNGGEEVQWGFSGVGTQQACVRRKECGGGRGASRCRPGGGGRKVRGRGEELLAASLQGGEERFARFRGAERRSAYQAQLKEQLSSTSTLSLGSGH